MTIEEFAAQPIEQIILHPAFVSIKLNREEFSPLMWEVTMKATVDEVGAYRFYGMLCPHERCKFYKMFTPIIFGDDNRRV